MNLLSFCELRPKKGIKYSRDHARRLGKVGKFPKPIKVTPCGRSVAYVEEEIDAHIAAQAAARDTAE